MREDILVGFLPDSGSRKTLHQEHRRYQWEGPAGKAAILQALIPNDSTFEDKLRTAYMAYLIFRGLNFFFGPTFIGPTNDGIPISDYAQMQQALGLPTAPATDSQYGTDPGFRLSRSNVAYLRFVDLLQYVGAARATPVLTELV